MPEMPPDAGAIAEATLSIWRQVAARLSPVIGVRGVDILLGRSLHLTSTAFPWLAIAGSQRDSATVLASIRTRLAGSRENPALFFTVLGEPPLKMLRYQQQFSFFDPATP